MSHHKNSYIDHQALAAQFTVGEFVRKVDAVRGKEFANFLEGRVEAVLKGIGFVDVAFPWGTDRMSPDLLVRVNKSPAVAGDFLDSYDRRKGGYGTEPIERVASAYSNHTAHLKETAWRMREAGIQEMDAYLKMAATFSDTLGDGPVREAISFVYEPSRRVAIYWKQKGRQYVTTQAERESGNLGCPRCKTQMGRTIYQKRTKLYACPECLFLIQPCDLVDPNDPASDTGDCEDDGLSFSDSNSVLNDWI